MKKGLLYTSLVALFLMVLLVVVFISNRYTFVDRQEIHEQRIRTMNSFLDDLYDDINKRAAQITTERVFIALDQHIADTNFTYIGDVDLKFKSLFVNGTINGTESTYLENSSLEDYLDRVGLNAASININLSVNVTDVKLTQSSPWYVDVTINMTIHLRDRASGTRPGVAEWILNKTLATRVSITGFRDPLYTVNCYSAVSFINRSPYALGELVEDTFNENDTTKFKRVIERDATNRQNVFLFASEYAPSFLMRYQGNFSPSPYGVFSFIDLNYLQDKDCYISLNKSNVDYVYFDWWFNASQYNYTTATGSTSAYVSVCDVQNMTDHFRMLRYDGPWNTTGGNTAPLNMLDAVDVGILNCTNHTNCVNYLDHDNCTDFRTPGPPPS